MACARSASTASHESADREAIAPGRPQTNSRGRKVSACYAIAIHGQACPEPQRVLARRAVQQHSSNTAQIGVCRGCGPGAMRKATPQAAPDNMSGDTQHGSDRYLAHASWERSQPCSQSGTAITKAKSHA